MKIVTLVENTTQRKDLTAEHGLSLYIETGKHKILFDAGQTGAFADNARKLGIDLQTVDFAVLSHGHYDHGGGLQRFLEVNSQANVYVNRHAFAPYYNAAGKYIGLDQKLQKNNRLIFTDGVYSLGDGMTLCTLDAAPEDTSGLQVLEEGVLRPEDFRHEQYLLVEENGRRILISGCSHKSIVQIAAHFQAHILVGGFHFMKLEDERLLTNAAKALLEQETTYYTGHCTGQRQFAFLKTLMGERLHALSTGRVLEI